MSPSSSLRGSQLKRVSTLTANSPKMAPDAPRLTVTAPRTTAGCSQKAAAAAPAHAAAMTQRQRGGYAFGWLMFRRSDTTGGYAAPAAASGTQSGRHETVA
eukprot:GHRQ01037973.1.p1 GENE.GHRQ01037973.1~~GHRQ01037973.1.p1  ORF type:complete len:101 (-),score=18.95 GHRQ01037973.1:184-486(-)